MLNPVGAFYWCSARPKLQPRVLSLVLVVVWFNRSRSEASPSVVHQDKYLPGNVIRQLHLSDWLLCLSACESATECISYNFDPRLGICDINDAGLNTADSERKCQEDSNLVFSKGVIFHQIRDWRGIVDAHHQNFSATGKGPKRPLETTSPPSQTSRIPELTSTAPPASTEGPGTTSDDSNTYSSGEESSGNDYGSDNA